MSSTWPLELFILWSLVGLLLWRNSPNQMMDRSRWLSRICQQFFVNLNPPTLEVFIRSANNFPSRCYCEMPWPDSPNSFNRLSWTLKINNRNYIMQFVVAFINYFVADIFQLNIAFITNVRNGVPWKYLSHYSGIFNSIWACLNIFIVVFPFSLYYHSEFFFHFRIGSWMSKVKQVPLQAPQPSHQQWQSPPQNQMWAPQYQAPAPAEFSGYSVLPSIPRLFVCW